MTIFQSKIAFLSTNSRFAVQNVSTANYEGNLYKGIGNSLH